MTYRKKLIEVALPLEAINAESAREKSIRHGHPSTLHLWWARRPLAACRAVLFASLVDDPSSRPEEFPTEASQERERQRLFRIIEELVKWENVNNETVLDAARREISRSTNGNPPPVLDPFCGGGSIPLEAQRLGLKAYASDLNPVAVLITKALIEIPPRFAGRPPVNPEARKKLVNASEWRGAAGLAEDVRYYGKWMHGEAEKRIGDLYAKVKLPRKYGGIEATVIAWLWARTVRCPNPACRATMPLVRSFWLSTKAGKKAWIEPITSKRERSVRFEVRTGEGAPPNGTVDRRGTRCIVCGEAVPFSHVRAEAQAGRMGEQLMAIVADSANGRVYISPPEECVADRMKMLPTWTPETSLPEHALSFRVQLYGMTKHRDLFTRRQLHALATFSDLVNETRERVCTDAITAGLRRDDRPNSAGGDGARAYSEAVALYLAEAVSKLVTFHNTLAYWRSKENKSATGFGRQALAMTWDYTEVNPFAGAGGDFEEIATHAAPYVITRALPATTPAMVTQLDAAATLIDVESPLISTDPPYFDNIGYADLSDVYYVWMRHTLGRSYPDLFSTLLTPKTQELIATPYRFEGDRKRAEEHFLTGLGNAFHLMREKAHPEFPVSVYYAFKQSEEDEIDEGRSVAISSTGWETMLEGLLAAGFQITGTVPLRTENPGRAVAQGTNALASSIVLVCRPRAENASLATRRELIATLRRELPDALRKLQQGNVAPVDFAQAAIGPGMAIFSRYSKILEADGSSMLVRTALQLINQELETYFQEQEGDLDADTRFCVAWFEQFGMDEAAFGEADVLARAKNTSVEGLVHAGVLRAKAGKVRLLKRDELSSDWVPLRDPRLTVWECTQYLIRALGRGGEEEAAKLAAQLGGGRSEDARALAYRLYSICERKGWTQEALAYNTLVASWSDVQTKTSAAGKFEQGKMDLG